MRRFLSWVVFLITMSVVIFVGNMLLLLLAKFFIWLQGTGFGSFIMHWIGIASPGLTLVVAIITSIYGIPVAIKCSETVYQSRAGARYLVYAIIELVMYGIVLIGCIMKVVEFKWNFIFCTIIGIALLFMYKKRLGDTYPQKEKSIEKEIVIIEEPDDAEEDRL